MTVESIKLNTGAELPLLGLGTWQAKDEAELTLALKTALDTGYRLIDTAFLYQNEHIIGKVLHEYISEGKIKREDLFITSKLPFTAHSAEDVPACVESQLAALQLDYIDLYLIHCPCPYQKQPNSFMPALEDGSFVSTMTSHLETWKALEDLYNQGKLKALGLSNFNAAQIKALYEVAEVKPANLQVECHIYWPQKELYDLCKELNITFTAYGPLGSPGRKAARPDGVWPEGDPMTENKVQIIAKKHGKTAAQVLLRQLTQRGISVIPKSVNPDRIVENFSIFDFKLDEVDLQELDSITTRVRLFIMDFASGHAYFPHDEINQSEIPNVVLHLH